MENGASAFRWKAGRHDAVVSQRKAGVFPNMSYTQEDRFIGITSPLGEDVLLLESFRGEEGVSRLFHFDLSLASENRSIDFSSIIGRAVTIRITLYDGSKRYINGYVSRFSLSGGDRQFARYHMEMVPWLWFLTRHADCRIFQNMTIPAIIEQVFKDRGYTDFKSNLTGTYEEREYCVQYRESDFQFVSRLMEEYGIFYFFEHEESKHTLVLADSTSAWQPCPNQSSAGYNLARGGLDSEDVVEEWNMSLELRSGKYSMTDYNFETPSTSLMKNEETVLKYANNTILEIYDYPGKYETTSQGGGLAKIRMQEEEAAVKIARGASCCRAFFSGYKFDLADFPVSSMNVSYALTTVYHEAAIGPGYSSGAAPEESYSNRFTCMPADVTFRPPRVTPKPVVPGPQTAVVVGKSGEEIWVDQYGRVKVQFFWDRVGQNDENSSCWIRVSQLWAGKNWGAMWIPRIGQEVIVEFLEGDPDRPIITGRVYNADQVVPYKLPDFGTRSTLLSRSSKGGGSANFNEIRFEDKKGSEQVFINAEKDMDLRVEKESREFVGANRHLIVKEDQKEKVEGSSHSEIVKNFNQKIGENMSLKVGENRQIEISADQKEKFGGSLHSEIGAMFNQKVGANMSLQVGTELQEKSGVKFAHEAGVEIHLKAGVSVVLEAGAELTLKVGGSFISMNPAEISIQAPMVLINSGGAAGAGTGSSPQSPEAAQPTAPEAPDTADDGSKGDKLS
jgi:type VI secretion system secreted protein VgrG